ncbi:hypothetical protein FSP39_020548, partial [Pinctada imbricata]
YAANEVIGIPNVYPNYGDLKGAWAQKSLNENEYIQVRFEYEIYIEEVNIYETYNCGGVWKVEIMTIHGWVTVWEIPSLQVQLLKDSRIFSPDIIFVQHPSNMVKLTVNCAHADSWVEIDAIQITGSIDLTGKRTEYLLILEQLRNYFWCSWVYNSGWSRINSVNCKPILGAFAPV